MVQNYRKYIQTVQKVKGRYKKKKLEANDSPSGEHCSFLFYALWK